jgi:hypothetical protein
VEKYICSLSGEEREAKADGDGFHMYCHAKGYTGLFFGMSSSIKCIDFPARVLYLAHTEIFGKRCPYAPCMRDYEKKADVRPQRLPFGNKDAQALFAESSGGIVPL